MKSLYDKREAELIERLKSLEVSPPDGLWDSIDETIRLKRSRKILIITSVASAATVALLVTVGGLSLMNLEEKSTIAAKTSTETNKNLKIINPTSESKKISKDLIGSNNICSVAVKMINSNNTNQDAIDSEHNSDVLKREDAPNYLNSIKPSLKTKTLQSSRPLITDQTDKKKNEITISENFSPKKHKGEWFISASGFPVYSFHSAGLMKKDGTQNESGLMSWGGSFSFRYKFSNSFSFEGGVAINTLGEKEKDLFLASSFLRRPSNSTTSVSSSYGSISITDSNYSLMEEADVLGISPLVAVSYTKVRATQQFRYIEFPVLIVKQFFYKGFSLGIKVGVSESILIGNKFNLVGDKVSIGGKTQGVDVYSTSAISAFSVSIPFSKRVNLLIEPNIKVGLKSLSTNYGKSFPVASYVKFGVEVPL